jgi:hypothetical protein
VFVDVAAQQWVASAQETEVNTASSYVGKNPASTCGRETVDESQVLPASAVATTESLPTPTQPVPPAQETEVNAGVPDGELPLHEPPALVVRSINPPPGPPPTAMHAVALRHETLDRLAVADENWLNHPRQPLNAQASRAVPAGMTTRRSQRIGTLTIAHPLAYTPWPKG